MGYIYIQCLNFLVYRGGGGGGGEGVSSCENGSYRTCCTNGLGMYTPPPASRVISVCMAAKIKTLHGVLDTQKLQ